VGAAYATIWGRRSAACGARVGRPNPLCGPCLNGRSAAGRDGSRAGSGPARPGTADGPTARRGPVLAGNPVDALVGVPCPVHSPRDHEPHGDLRAFHRPPAFTSSASLHNQDRPTLVTCYRLAAIADCLTPLKRFAARGGAITSGVFAVFPVDLATGLIRTQAAAVAGDRAAVPASVSVAGTSVPTAPWNAGSMNPS
jgi:hypothetical protein